nr:MAG TPA: MRN-interacting protein [Caudoviricetes sp.]
MWFGKRQSQPGTWICKVCSQKSSLLSVRKIPESQL